MSEDKHKQQVNHPNPTLAQHRIFMEVLRERQRQKERWGNQEHSDAVWALILGEEFGEVQKAILESICDQPEFKEYNDKRLETELIQVLAVGFQWLEVRRS